LVYIRVNWTDARQVLDPIKAAPEAALQNLAGGQGLSSAKSASTRTALPFAAPDAVVRKGSDASADRHPLFERRGVIAEFVPKRTLRLRYDPALGFRGRALSVPVRFGGRPWWATCRP
jgi:hypothetical protein